MTIAFVSSQGGHAGQMRLLFTPEVVGNHKAIFITESESAPRTMKSKGFQNKYTTYYLEKDHLLSLNLFTYMKSIRDLYRIFKRNAISLVVTNGAQLSITAAIAARLCGVPVIFIDTVVRVKTPNWSARACYYLSDMFIVQHRSMIATYGPRAIYRGEII